MSYYKGKPKVSSQSVQDVLSLPLSADCLDRDKEMQKRGLTKATLNHFKYRTMFDENTGRAIAHYLPVTKEGELVGYIKRALNVPKKIAWSVVGENSTECDLLGQNKLPSNRRKLFIVEGMYDVASLYQALRYSKYNLSRDVPIEPCVVSIGLGTKNAQAHISSNYELVSSFKDLVLVFDNDKATPEEKEKGVEKGQDAVTKVAMAFPNLFNVVLTRNDPNDFIQHREGEELARQATFEAKEYKPDELVEGGVDFESLYKPLQSGVYVPVFPETMRVLHGMRDTEMTLIIAPPNVGKSTAVKEIGYALVKTGRTVGHLFLEETIEKTQQSYIALDNDVPLAKYRENPKIIDKGIAKESYDNLINNGKTYWVDDKTGHLSPEATLDNIRWMATRGCKYIILDHISFVFSGSVSTNERKDIDLLLTQMAAFVKESGVHLIVVAHIKRLGFKPYRDKDGNVKYPYWVDIQLDDARGSGAFEQISWNVIAIEPEWVDGGQRGRVRTKVLKNREWGWLGICDVLTMHPQTGRLVKAEEYTDE